MDVPHLLAKLSEGGQFLQNQLKTTSGTRKVLSLLEHSVLEPAFIKRLENTTADALTSATGVFVAEEANSLARQHPASTSSVGPTLKGAPATLSASQQSPPSTTSTSTAAPEFDPFCPSLFAFGGSAPSSIEDSGRPPLPHAPNPSTSLPFQTSTGGAGPSGVGLAALLGPSALHLDDASFLGEDPLSDLIADDESEESGDEDAAHRLRPRPLGSDDANAHEDAEYLVVGNEDKDWMFVEKQDAIDALAQFLAVVLASMPEAKNAQPKELQKAVAEALREMRRGRIKRCLLWSRHLYRAGTMAYGGVQLFQNPWVVNAVVRTLWAAAKYVVWR